MAFSKNFQSNNYDSIYIHQLVVYDLRLHELQDILKAFNQNKYGEIKILRKRVLDMLSVPYYNRQLKEKILHVYNSRSILNLYAQKVSMFMDSQPLLINSRINSVQLMPSTNSFDDNNTPHSETSPNPANKIEHIPFFNVLQSLIIPLKHQKDVNGVKITGFFYLRENIRRTIAESWDFVKQKHKIQIILKLVQVGLEKNVTERLPNNITVSVNDRLCALPILNIPINMSSAQWRCNIPIDVTEQIELGNGVQNKIQLTWSREKSQFTVHFFVAKKLTLDEVIEQLTKKPMRPSNKTKEFIKQSMENDAAMSVDSMIATIKDPLSKIRMELPARGTDCEHMQCFDAIQYLYMNEKKQTWKCPICINKVKLENIEVDEFFLNILKSPNLSKECENVHLLKDGSWIEKQIKEFSNMSKSDNKQSTGIINIFSLSDSDDESNMPVTKRFKKISSKYEESKTKFGHTVSVKNITKTNDINSIKHRPLLNPSFNNSASTSSKCQSMLLNDYSDHTYGSPLDLTIIENNNMDNEPCSSWNDRKRKPQEKEKSKNVLCVITLD